jgi:hypothetical protein
MKQYEKIYVIKSHPDTKYTVCTWDQKERIFVGLEDVIQQSNVIVLTEEELREVFSVGYDFAKNVPGNKDFQELMQSKGIKI